MLPRFYHPHDEKWIKEQMQRLPRPYRAVAASKYSKVYESTYNAENRPHIKHNAARREANTRLRKYIDRAIK